MAAVAAPTAATAARAAGFALIWPTFTHADPGTRTGRVQRRNLAQRVGCG